MSRNGDQPDAGVEDTAVTSVAEGRANRGARSRPGRPRDPNVDAAVTAATFDLLAEVGFARLSITAVAQRAGVGKPAIYRRWRSKADMVVDLLDRSAPVSLRDPRTGTFRGDLIALCRQMVEATRGDTGRLQLALVADLPFDAELASAYRERLLATRGQVVRTVVERAVRAGEVRGDTDPELVADIATGVIHHRLSVTGTPVDGGIADRVAQIVLDGVADR